MTVVVADEGDNEDSDEESLPDVRPSKSQWTET